MTLKQLNHNASSLLTPGYRVGAEHPSFDDYEVTLDLGHRVDLEGLGLLLDEVTRRFNESELTKSDMWLAPRLHATLRLSRRQAADRNLWRWLGVVFAPGYVRWRFGSPDATEDHPDKAAPQERFDGPDYKHALARLWWMAELFRDGPDYRPVERALSNQDIPNNLFRLDIAHHRPTVQAAVTVLEGKSGREANALAKAINSTATTLLVDVVAPDSVELDPEALQAWLHDDDYDPGAYLEVLPSGPHDPEVDPTSVAAMAALLTRLLAEAPVRDRKGGGEQPAPED